MKKLFAILIVAFSLTSCISQKSIERYYDQHPAFALKRNKTGCQVYPKPIYREKKWWSN